ncbi:MAG: DUF6125 family protein [Methanomicrobiaceae archaeon]|nr:DUF6125 family protein [Methanomicrobiaceae archaeon]
MVRRYPEGSDEDRELLMRLSPDALLDLLFLQVRNVWRVDGLYFLLIEERFGTEVASRIDAEFWEQMAAIEAAQLLRLFEKEKNPGIPECIRLLRLSGWALDQPFKTISVSEREAEISVIECRTQDARMAKGREVFPCREVRLGYLREFAGTINPSIGVRCISCPPERTAHDCWCRWRFFLKERAGE